MYMKADAGPYRVASPDDVMLKVFEGPEGGKRTFKIVISNAFDAGIIGSEYNGVAVLDEDNRQVLTDQVCCNNVAAQRKAAAALMAADWPTFAQWIRETPRYRRNAANDVEHAGPVPNYAYPMAASDDWVVMTIDQEGPEDDPITYPAKTRRAIIDEILTHAVHRADPYGDWRLAWNIKVYSYDTSGKVADVEIDAAHDAAWAAHLAEHGEDVFRSAQEQALSMWMNNEYTVHPGINQGDYHFRIEGRSNGWLALDRIDGVGPFRFGSMNDLEEALMGFDKDALAKLYVLLRHVDHDVTRTKCAEEMAYQTALVRQAWEEDLVPTVSP